MTEKLATSEPTFADAITSLAAATDLTEEVRRYWRSSLTGIARAFDQPLGADPGALQRRSRPNVGAASCPVELDA